MNWRTLAFTRPASRQVFHLALRAAGRQGSSLFFRFLQVHGHMSEPFQFIPQFDPMPGADLRDESFLRLTPGWQAARERVLSFVRDGQKSLSHPPPIPDPY